MTIDSAGAFLIGELERLDPQLHEPLVDCTWSRDCPIRTDVTPADELASFTNSTFATAGGVNPAGKNWIGKESNAIAGPALDIVKTAQPLHQWGIETKYTMRELISAQKLGRSIDAQQFNAMRMKYQMDVDENVYIGDKDLGFYGLLNAPAVKNTSNVANGKNGTPQWKTKTPQEILADVNELLNATWKEAGWAVMPNRILLPPEQFGYLASQIVSSAGNRSILSYLLENNICTQRGGKLEILPVKWLIGLGAGGTLGQLGTVDRMMAYRNEYERIRYPLTEIQRTPLEYRSVFQVTTYWCLLGQMEFVYPATMGYRDGI